MKRLRPRAVALALLLLASLGVGLPAHGAGPMLSIRREGTNVIVNFTALLQGASRAEGPYTNVIGATSPYLWPVSAAPEQYWRSATAGGATFSGGSEFTVALKTDGGMRSWGWNDSGQLGTPGAGSWMSVACGYVFTVALKADGSLWSWGGNSAGQLGIGSYDFQPHYQPVQVGLDANWAAVACGDGHTLALKANGSLWAWGRNGYGQLGNGTYGWALQPVRVGSEMDWMRVACAAGHSAALKTDGSVWAWGDNVYGELGNGTYDRTNQPVRVGSDADWQAVACGGFEPALEEPLVGHTVALKTDGTLWAWGANRVGQLGNGTFDSTNRPVRVGSDADWIVMACGVHHTVALKADGTLWTWGYNYVGQLGNGTFDSTNRPVRVGSDTDWIRVTCGNSHTLALKGNGTLWAWGNGAGSGTPSRVNQPVQVGMDTDWAR
jgi:alpha-tubulin suppressor-like RCC1 family protein